MAFAMVISHVTLLNFCRRQFSGIVSRLNHWQRRRNKPVLVGMYMFPRWKNVLMRLRVALFARMGGGWPSGGSRDMLWNIVVFSIEYVCGAGC